MNKLYINTLYLNSNGTDIRTGIGTHETICKLRQDLKFLSQSESENNDVPYQLNYDL